MRAWLLCALVGMLSAPVIAAESGRLTEFQITHVQNQIKTYFSLDHMDGGNISPFIHLSPQPPTIELLLKELRARVQAGMNSTTRARGNRLLFFAHGLASRSELPSPEMKVLLQDVLHDLLVLNQQPGSHRHHLLEIFDRFELWSPREMWFFENIQSANEVTEHLHRIRALLKTTGKFEAFTIARTLRAIRPVDLTALAVLSETGHMTEAELVAMLRIASTQFARALSRSPPDQDEEVYNYRIGDPRARLIAGKLRVIMRQLAKGDRVVGSAFTKAFTQAQNSNPQDYEREDRLHFFALLQERRLDWTNQASWRQPAGLFPEEVPLQERYRVDGNMIVVNFQGGSCEDDL